MPVDEKLADRVRQQLKGKRGIEEKKMFGGLCFMVNGHMCCGVEGDCLVVRVGPDRYEDALAKKHARPMDFTGKPLKGFVYVDWDGFKTEQTLRNWIQLGMNFIRTLPKNNGKGIKAKRR